MITLEKLNILTPLQELSKNVGDWGKLIVATGLEKLPKVQEIAQSGHTDWVIPILNRKNIKLIYTTDLMLSGLSFHNFSPFRLLQMSNFYL